MVADHSTMLDQYLNVKSNIYSQ